MAVVLVTRPEETAERTAASVRSTGHQALLAPVLRIEPLPGLPPDLDGVQALLVTSRQAVPALAAWPARPPVHAIGAGTATALAAAGIQVAGTGDGDGEALGRRLAQRLDPAAGPLLHVGGATTTPGLRRTLAAAGFVYRLHPVYRTVPAPALPAAAHAALQAGRVAAVTLHSPASARHFVELIRAADLESALAGVTALCLSANVAAEANTLRWKTLEIAAQSDEAGMGALLEALPL